MNISYLRSRGMTAFTVDYLIWHHFGVHLDECNEDILRQYRSYFHHHPNPANLAAFIETYLKWVFIYLILEKLFFSRTDISFSRDGSTGPKLNIPVLQIVGARSAFIHDTVHVNSLLDPARSEYIKISDSCGLVLDDRPDAVTEALMLFLQGLGYCRFFK